MKKIILFLMLLIMPLSVSAKNIIHSIDIDVYLNDDGSANITEVWDVDGSDGTEWYKVINNLGNMELSNFTVSMDGKLLNYKVWNVDESLKEKRGYYGINYTSKGLELCFGKYDYKRHKFTLNYTLSNFIINTSDSQLIYYNFIDKLSSVDFRNFSVNISSYYEFPDTLDVWGYGYKGYAYVNSGKIGMSNEENSKMNDKYTVLLAKFPLGTFNTYNSVKGYNDFETVYNMAKMGSYDYDYSNNSDNSYSKDWFFATYERVMAIIIVFLVLPIVLIERIIVRIKSKKEKSDEQYGYIKNKVIDYNKIGMYRDIPCGKNIYYAHTLLRLNNFQFYNEVNILGAIILKWVRNGKVVFRNKQKGVFNKNTSVIDLTLNPSFDNKCEAELFQMMYKASRNGYLQPKELEDWCEVNCYSFLSLLNRFDYIVISTMKNSNMVYERKNKSECKYKNVMNDQVYEDSVKLYGLKKYLEEFSSINTKEVMDVKLWDEYLMFAYLFGIADEVSKQLKNMYPEIIPLLENNDFDYDNTFSFINDVCSRSIVSAKVSKISRDIADYSSASSYSSGGGGFSSGGGGGGSFGGGGGGSR